MSGVYKANFASWLALPTDTTLPNLVNKLKLILWARRLNINGRRQLTGTLRASPVLARLSPWDKVIVYLFIQDELEVHCFRNVSLMDD